MASLRIFICAIFSIGFYQTAAALEIRCPANLMETPGVVSPDPLWTIAATTGERPLDSVGVYWGSTDQRGAQVPDDTQKIKSLETVTWQLPKADGGHYWVGCSYTNTTAMLYQKIVPTYSRCTATYTLLPSGRRLRLAAMLCQ